MIRLVSRRDLDDQHTKLELRCYFGDTFLGTVRVSAQDKVRIVVGTGSPLFPFLKRNVTEITLDRQEDSSSDLEEISRVDRSFRENLG